MDILSVSYPRLPSTDHFIPLVAPFIHLFAFSPFARAQVGPSLVGESCTADVDCDVTEDTGEQIGCGVDELCGGKGAQCYYDGNYYGYTETCASRTSLSLYETPISKTG